MSEAESDNDLDLVVSRRSATHLYDVCAQAKKMLLNTVRSGRHSFNYGLSYLLRKIEREADDSRDCDGTNCAGETLCQLHSQDPSMHSLSSALDQICTLFLLFVTSGLSA